MMDYSKQALLIGVEEQESLLNKTVCIVGVGGTGSAAASLLARSGLNLVLVDGDILERSNVYRQVLYTEGDVGKKKVLAAKESLQAVNPGVKVEAHPVFLNEDNARGLVKGDVLVDCTDNMDTRKWVNEVCYGKIPWVFCSAAEYSGMMMPFSARGKPCFRCVFGKGVLNKPSGGSGVLAPVPATVGGIAATEALKVLVGKADFGKLYHYDFMKNRMDVLEVEADKKCGVCGE